MPMLSEPELAVPQSSGSTLRNVLLAVAAVYVVVSLYLMFDMHGRLAKVESTQATAAINADKLARRLTEDEAETKASQQAIARQVGMTEEQLARRSAELQRQQRAAESRLAAQGLEIGKVSGEVAGVKGEVAGVKGEVGNVRGDLETTKGKLDRAIGDLGQQSGLIARTRDDLEVLKHRGDRNYYEFTLTKSRSTTPVSTVSLQLKKADPKRGKFTLNVIADDRTIEKKDRTIYEPLQFYTGRDRMLYELVVFTVGKDRVSGYISTPKNAPTPAPTGN
jgi:multidrug efflux pump subunit AcrA (membrane-fusion protein)